MNIILAMISVFIAYLLSCVALWDVAGKLTALNLSTFEGGYSV